MDNRDCQVVWGGDFNKNLLGRDFLCYDPSSQWGLSIDTLVEVDIFILSKVLPSELPLKLKHTVVALRFVSCLTTCLASRLPGDRNYG